MALSRRLLLVSPLALAACAGFGPPPADGNGWVRLPPEADNGLLGDADRRAVSVIRATLVEPSRQAGNPAAQAQALGWYEYATVALNAPRWEGLNPLAVIELRKGREALRDFYGIRQTALAQDVLVSFFRAGAALSVGDQAGAVYSFPAAILTVPPDQVVARLLAQPPPELVSVARASAFAGSAMDAMDGGNAEWD